MMKRAMICGIAALSLLLPLAGCGEQPAEPEATPAIREPVEDTAAPAETEPAETPEATPKPTPTPDPTPTPPVETTARPVSLLEALYGAGDFNAPFPVSYETMDPALDQAGRIQQIRAWYQETEGNTEQYERRAYDDSFTAYWDGGALAKIEVTELLDPGLPEGTKYYYYYKDGNPYFIYVADSEHELRFYYWNGEMIRWIESDRVAHDSANAAYARYYETAWRLYQVVSALG